MLLTMSSILSASLNSTIVMIPINSGNVLDAGRKKGQNICKCRIGKLQLRKSLKYIDLDTAKSGAPGLFILTGSKISENKRLWTCPQFGFPRYCSIMPVSLLPN